MDRAFTRRIAVALLGAAAAGSQPLEIAVHYLPQEVIQRRLAAVPRKQIERLPEIESLFREAGCDGAKLTEVHVERSKDPDAVCTLEGGGPGEIVVGGHFDFVTAGRGAVDDWSGVSLLPSLFEGLKAAPRRHTFVLVGFAAEETGLWGSKSYVGSLSAGQRSDIRAMINLECLGTGPPKVWASRADKKLLEAYARVSRLLGIPPAGVNVERVGDDDSHPFLNAGIPVITIHSVTQQSLRLLHNSHDNLEAIHPDDYYKSYQLAAAYLTYLDSALP